MVIFELDGRPDCFDFLAFDSPKQFAREKAANRWIALRGEMPAPETTAEALEREGELCTPKCIMITQDGDWERVSEVRYAEDVKAATNADAQRAASPAEDREFLQETTAPVEPKSAFDFSKFKGST